jgi:hypothetical protein
MIDKSKRTKQCKLWENLYQHQTPLATTEILEKFPLKGLVLSKKNPQNISYQTYRMFESVTARIEGNGISTTEQEFRWELMMIIRLQWMILEL